MSNLKSYHTCFVPLCTNNTKSSPYKHFFCVPQNVQRRNKWFLAVRRPNNKTTSNYYCCEDHFDMYDDTENYMRHRLVGGRLILKKDAVPHKFPDQSSKEIQAESNKKLSTDSQNNISQYPPEFIECVPSHSELFQYRQLRNDVEEYLEPLRTPKLENDDAGGPPDPLLSTCVCCLTRAGVELLWAERPRIGTYGEAIRKLLGSDLLQSNVSDSAKLCRLCALALKRAMKFRDQLMKAQERLAHACRVTAHSPSTRTSKKPPPGKELQKVKKTQKKTKKRIKKQSGSDTRDVTKNTNIARRTIKKRKNTYYKLRAVEAKQYRLARGRKQPRSNIAAKGNRKTRFNRTADTPTGVTTLHTETGDTMTLHMETGDTMTLHTETGTMTLHTEIGDTMIEYMTDTDTKTDVTAKLEPGPSETPAQLQDLPMNLDVTEIKVEPLIMDIKIEDDPWQAAETFVDYDE